MDRAGLVHDARILQVSSLAAATAAAATNDDCDDLGYM